MIGVGTTIQPEACAKQSGPAWLFNFHSLTELNLLANYRAQRSPGPWPRDGAEALRLVEYQSPD